MPIYEFRCSNCGHKFETLCRMGETGSGLECPHCGSRSLSRLVSAFRVMGGGSAGGAGGGNGSSGGCAGCSSRSCSTCR